MEQVYIERDLDEYNLTKKQETFLSSSEGWVGIGGRIIEEEFKNLIGGGKVTGLRLDTSTPALDSLVLSLETRTGINLETALHILRGSLKAFEVHIKYPAFEGRSYCNFQEDVKPSLTADYTTKEKEIEDTLRVGIPSQVTSPIYEMIREVGLWHVGSICPSWSGVEDWITLYNQSNEHRFAIRMDPGSLHGIEISPRGNREGVLFYFEDRCQAQLAKLPRGVVNTSCYQNWDGALIQDLEMKE